MELPEGFHSPSSSHTSPVYKLNKSLDSLKQASRQWYSKLSQTLLAIGFPQASSAQACSPRKQTAPSLLSSY